MSEVSQESLLNAQEKGLKAMALFSVSIHDYCSYFFLKMHLVYNSCDCHGLKATLLQHIMKKKQKSAAVASCFVLELVSPGESPFNKNLVDVGCFVTLNSLQEFTNSMFTKLSLTNNFRLT